MDIVYCCDRCGKYVFEYHILYGPHCCPKCGGRKVIPFAHNLTKFGVFLLSARNNFFKWCYEKAYLKYDKEKS